MKKFISSLIVISVMVFGVSFTSSAQGRITVSVGDVTAAQSKVVGVPVELSNNTGVWGMVFDIRYDTEYFKYSEVRNNAEIFENGAYMIGPKNPSDGYVRVLITPSELTVNNTKNGRICTVYFEVSKETPDGEYPLTLKIDEDGVCDAHSNTVSVMTSNGSITVNSTYKGTDKNPESCGDVIATTASNQKTGKNINNIENQTEISEVFATDKNGEPVTDENGDKITEKVIVDKDTGEIIGEANTDLSNILTDYTIVFVVIGCILIAGIIVAVVLFIKKRKA